MRTTGVSWWRGESIEGVRVTSLCGHIEWSGALPCKAGMQRGTAVSRGPLALWFDGTLYELQGEAPGASDADRFISLVERVGLDAALDCAVGDFAVALFDERHAKVFLARDRFGLRPCYYVRTWSDVAFASRIRELFKLSDIPIEPRPAFVARYAASHYRTFDNEEELSPFQGVMQVPAGCIVEIDAKSTRTRRYWSLVDQGDTDGDETSLAARLGELLHAAVARRTSCARQPMFTLSGGMDSSSVLFTAARHMQVQPIACSAVYEHGEYDESNEIRESLNGTGIEWRPIEVSNDLDVTLLVEAVRAHDEPLATATWLAHYQLCRAAAAMGAIELFDGLGGDELNAGEYEYFPFSFADLQAAGDDAALQHEIACWVRLHDHPIHRKSRDVALASIARLTNASQRGRCVPDRGRTIRYLDVLDDEAAASLRSFQPALVHPFQEWLKNRAYQDLTRETMPCCLRASQRNTAAARLVNRSPFLDRDLVEFMFRIPGTMKIRNGVTKHLLREAMRGVLPEVVRTRVKKVGWNAPSDRWFTGAGAAMMRDLVSSQRFRERGIYRTERLLELIDEHERIVTAGEARENHMMLLWQALNLDIWLREVEAMRRERLVESRQGIDDRLIAQDAAADGIEGGMAARRQLVR
jgi:asparagine synthase (glutamine-hydrolysing)